VKFSKERPREPMNRFRSLCNWKAPREFNPQQETLCFNFCSTDNTCSTRTVKNYRRKLSRKIFVSSVLKILSVLAKIMIVSKSSVDPRVRVRVSNSRLIRKQSRGEIWFISIVSALRAKGILFTGTVFRIKISNS